MFLHRLHLNLRCREVRRDLADPYQLHATLCRAFSPEDKRCLPGAFLWRLEPETDASSAPRILIQSREIPDWPRINLSNWLERDPDPAVNLVERLKMDAMRAGQRYRFRLRANPATSKNGKRLGLLKLEDQEAWLLRKGQKQHGFTLPCLTAFDAYEGTEARVDVRISQEQMLRARQHDGNGIRVFSVLFDGTLEVTEPDAFRVALTSGIGHGKALGLGLLSVIPVS